MTSVIEGLLGKSDKPINALQNFRPVGIRSGGFNFDTRDPSVIRGGATPERQGLVSNLSGLFKTQASELGDLKSLVRPGFSQLRTALGGVQQARLGQVDTSRERAIGDLRENLSRRRVLGSSFGQDALSRADAEFSQQRDQIMSDIGLQQAQTTLQEIEATKQLLAEQFNASRASIQTFLENLNLEAGMAAQLATGATQALTEITKAQAYILQRQTDNTQEFLTELVGVGIGAASGNPGTNAFKTSAG